MEFEPIPPSFEEVVDWFCLRMDEVQAILAASSVQKAPHDPSRSKISAGPAPRAFPPINID
jgi:hypothetical protein